MPLSLGIGTVMFGRQPDGTEVPATMDLVRLAIPRGTYTQSHIDYVIEVCEEVAAKADALPGYQIVLEPKPLRHFTASFEPLLWRARASNASPRGEERKGADMSQTRR